MPVTHPDVPFPLTPVPAKKQRYCADCGALVTHRAWSPYWCPKHDKERVDRISAQMAKLAESFGIKEA